MTADPSRRIRVWSTILLGVLALLILATIARVVQLKVDPDPRLVDAMRRSDGTPMQHVRRTEAQPRGVIFDRRGQVVAMDVPTRGLFVDPRHIYREARNAAEKAERAHLRALAKDPNAPPPDISLDPIGDAVAALAERLGASPMELLRTVMSRVPADMHTLRRGASEEDMARIPRYVLVREELSDAEIEALRGLRMAGVGTEERAKRVYPFGSVAASLIGFVGAEHKGLGGIELRKERTLDSRPGTVVRFVDNRHQTIAIPAEGFDPGEAGSAVQLSIDMIVQEIVENVLEETTDFANAGGGRAIVVDIETGEVLAMHDVIRKRTGRSPVAVDPARDVHPALGRNRCVTDPYEPGSTFKPFPWSVATELGIYRPSDILNTPSAGAHVVSDGKHRRVIRDVKYYGPSSWERVLEKSMNAGMAIAAMRMTKKQMQEGIRRFGFGEPTNCGLPGESRGIVTSPKNWSMLHTQCSVAIGQEIGVTAVQMVRAFSAFCRDGSMVELSLYRVDPVLGPNVREVLPEKVALTTRNAMRGVMTEGTGHRANKIARYEVFGKSGTAQLTKPKGGGYYEDRYTSSFIAGAPFDDPRIAVLVVIDDPDKHKLGYNNYGGGAIAGPAAVTIINETLRYMGIPADRTDEESASLAAAR